MKVTDMPLWRQVFSPTNSVGEPSSQEELTEIRNSLFHNETIARELERFLYAEWQVKNTLARCELNRELRDEHQHTANAIAEILGMLYREDEIMTTKRKHTALL